VRADTLPELITELARSPGRYTFGGSLGSPSHIMGAWLNRLETVHVPYKGGSQSVGDVVGGHLDMSSQAQDPRAFLAQERDKFGRVVRELGITIRD